MELTEALRIIRALADGVDPHSGEVFPADSPYQHPRVVRALFQAVEAMKRAEAAQRRERGLPDKAGQAWDESEDKQLCEGFDKGLTIRELAQQHQRTAGSIQSRLDKLGKQARLSAQ